LKLILDRPHAHHAARGARGLNLLDQASDRSAQDHGAVDRVDGDLIGADATVVRQRLHDGFLKAAI
jgi:hypothetical protein